MRTFGVDKRDSISQGAEPRFFVDQSHACGFHLRESPLNIVDIDADMMQPLAVAFEETGDRIVGLGGG